jgi:tetratricopeptide (TPR) repeat protein
MTVLEKLHDLCSEGFVVGVKFFGNNGGYMDLKLKTISKDGIAEALSKVELYRYLNEPEEAESICHDILAADPENQIAQRLLGLTITDQFEGQSSDRYAEAEKIFQTLTDPYERFYYMGLLQERRAKAQIRAGRPAKMLVGSLHEAMRCFEEAEKIRPPHNDDAVLRWNRCVRLLEKIGHVEGESLESFLEDHDIAPVALMRPPGRRGR